jgi:glycine/D-amino acid oxidase-like deaminating enzyme
MTTAPRRKTIGVIGAGIIGVQLARALQRKGVDVSLFDRNDPGTGTSFGNAGYLATDEIFPLAHGTVLRRLPRLLFNPLGPLAMRWQELPRLLPWYLKYARACSSQRATRSIAALASLQSEAVAAWKEVIALEGLRNLVLGNGAMTVFESDLGFEKTRLQRQVQKDYGIAWQLLSGNAARDKVPELSQDVRHAVVYPSGMHVVNPLSVTQTIMQSFLSDGGTFVKANVDGLERSSGRIKRLRAGGKHYTFDAVVVSSGHLSGRLLKPLNYKVPIVAERGYHVEMSHCETRLNLPVGSYERGFYVTPMSSGLRLAGTSEFSSADHDEPATWGRADILKRHVAALMPGLAEQETGRWMGHRPTMPDFLPVLGAAPACENLFLAFGHHHLGLTLSAITARAMSELITTSSPSINIDAFALQRFQ